MPGDRSINLVKSPRDEDYHRLVKDGKIVGSVTIISRNEVRLQNAQGEVLGVFENTDLAIARIEELIDLQKFRVDPQSWSS